MAYSYKYHDGDGTTSTFDIEIDYLKEDHLKIVVDTVEQTEGVHYNIVGTDVSFTTGNIPASGTDNIQIIRETPRGKADRLVDFEDGAVLTESDLDTQALQNLYIAQEAFEKDSTGTGVQGDYIEYSTALGAWDGALNGTPKVIDRLAEPSDSDHAATKNYVDTTTMQLSGGNFNAESVRVENVSDPAGNQDAATKKYVEDILEWGIGGVPQLWTFTGGGGVTDFTLTGAGQGVEAKMLVVSLDGIVQVPDTDFSVEPDSDPDEDDYIQFTTAPEQNVEVVVQNFGKTRFVGSADIEDGSITTSHLADDCVTSAKIPAGAVGSSEIASSAVNSSEIASGAVDDTHLNQGGGSEAVVTNAIRRDAVTKDKIADLSVDYDRIVKTGFTGAPGGGSDQPLIVQADGDLTHRVLTHADVSDWGAELAVTPINDLGNADGNVHMGSNKITNLATPGSNNDAATKAYVDGQLPSDPGIVKLGDYQNSSAAGEFEISGWYSSSYECFEFQCYGFKVDTAGTFIAMLFADSSGTYQNSTGDYLVNYRVEATSPNGVGEDAYSGTLGAATPTMDDDNTGSDAYQDTGDFRLWLPNNRSGFSQRKHVMSEGSGWCGGEDTSAGTPSPGHGGGTSAFTYTFYKLRTTFTHSTSHITKIKFRSASDLRDTSAIGNIRAGARVIVYGRTH